MAMALHSVTVTDAKEECERGGAHPPGAPDWRRRGRGLQRSCASRTLVACCPSPPSVSAVCTAMSNNVNRHSARKYHTGGQADRYTDMHSGLHLNLVEGVAREVGREGGRDGRVSHAIGKGNYNCCTLLCAGGMDGRGAEGGIAIYMDGSEQRPSGRAGAGGRASEVSQGVSPSARGTRALDDGRGERAGLLRALSPSH